MASSYSKLHFPAAYILFMLESMKDIRIDQLPLSINTPFPHRKSAVDLHTQSKRMHWMEML
jgi:hypothetical protein